MEQISWQKAAYREIDAVEQILESEAIDRYQGNAELLTRLFDGTPVSQCVPSGKSFLDRPLTLTAIRSDSGSSIHMGYGWKCIW